MIPELRNEDLLLMSVDRPLDAVRHYPPRPEAMQREQRLQQSDCSAAFWPPTLA